MPLAETEKEIPQTNRVEGIGEVGQNVERELEKITEQAEEAVDQGTPRKTADVSKFERPSESRERPEVNREELQTKSIKELESALFGKLKATDYNDWQNDLMISAIINQMAEKITENEEKYENITSKILEIARNISDDDDGTYAWILSELEKIVNGILKKQPIM